MIENLPLGHVKISTGNINDIFEYIEKNISENKSFYCIPLNLTKYVISKNDRKLQEVIKSADLILSDGFPIAWLSRRAGYKDVNRITGIDLAEQIMIRSRERGWKLFFLGASSDNLERTVCNIKHRFNNPDVTGYQHGYFEQREMGKIIEIINNSAADILFLGLGMPQKEHLIHDHFKKIKVKFCLPVGGALDVWSGAKRRTPKLIQNIGLEWLYRSFYDISRAKLIAKYGLSFFKEILFYGK